MNNWNNAYSAYRRPFNVSPVREWAMAFIVVGMVIGAIAAAFVR